MHKVPFLDITPILNICLLFLLILVGTQLQKCKFSFKIQDEHVALKL